jgi:transcriptional regulator of acetoin/glycerol metabolism
VIEHLVVLASPGAVLGAEDIVFIDDGGVHDPGVTASFGASVMSMDYHTAREHVLSSFEVDYLKHVVGTSSGNISDAARAAGVDRTTLYRLMEKHGMGRDTLSSRGRASD